MFFDVSYIDTHLYVPTKYDETTTTYVKFDSLFPDVLEMSLYLKIGVIPDYKGDCYNSFIYAKLIYDRIKIEDFHTNINQLNKGYGSALFCSFLMTVAKLREKYPIRYIKGELVPKDFDYWQYSIHLYSKANEYCERYSIPLRLSSCVNGRYSFEEFLNDHYHHKNESVIFKYYFQ